MFNWGSGASLSLEDMKETMKGRPCFSKKRDWNGLGFKHAKQNQQFLIPLRESFSLGGSILITRGTFQTHDFDEGALSAPRYFCHFFLHFVGDDRHNRLLEHVI